MEHAQVTLADIAHQAGVSKATVSLALNNKPGVSDATRRRILRIAGEIGYVSRNKPVASSSTARRLVFLTCSSSPVVPLDYHAAPFFDELLYYVEDEARQHDYDITFVNATPDTLFQRLEKATEHHYPLGVLLLGTDVDAPTIKEMHDRHPMSVVIDTCFAELGGVDFVVMNNLSGGAMAADYLLNLGHTELGCAQSDVRIHNFEERLQGFQKRLSDRGASMKELRVYSVPSDIDKAETSFLHQLETGAGALPTAMFCESDYIAIGVQRALQRFGKRVPEDVSILGFDNIPQSRIVLPELTTINVDRRTIARVAIRRLVERVNGEDEPSQKIIIDTQLVERRSCTAKNQQDKTYVGRC
jgi:DNA-binding LacI/PurR family transcriptional regulator